MKTRYSKFCKALVICLIATAFAAAATYAPQNSNRVTLNFNRGWLFSNTDNASFSGGTGFSDATWTKVCLPQQNITIKHAYFNGGTIYTAVGAEYAFTSWYRKHYTPPASYSGRKFLLEFEGVATVATIYVNGTQVGIHQGAYTPFTLDITSRITVGQDNVIAVQVNSARQTGVPPEGGNIDYCVFGGIVRNVHLIVCDPLHVQWNWVSIPNCTTPTCTPNGIVTSHVSVVNNAATSKSVTATTSIVDKTGSVVATGTGTAAIAAGATSVITYPTSSAVTHFWSPDDPYLYTVYTQIQDGSTYVDEFIDTTGFRTILASKTTGRCYVNGVMTIMRGLNHHESFPFMGRAASTRLERKDAEILKYDLGCNFVRCSHYPQAPDFIKRCDQLGIFLLEEIPGWSYIGGGDLNTPTSWQGLLLQDLKDMIYRDRNRPSVLTFGVRVNESVDNDALYGPMNDTARAIDPTRPTSGVRRGGNTTVASFLEDIYTRNFGSDPVATDPKPTFITETVGHTITPQIHAWDSDVTQLASAGQLQNHIDEQQASYSNAYEMGKLGWCAFDYNSPHLNATTNETDATVDLLHRSLTPPYESFHGVANIFRIPKFAGMFFQSQRNPATCGYMVYIANDRTPASPSMVLVLSNCPTVELFRDGVSLGSKSGTIGPNLPHPVFQWTGVAAGGTLKAIGSAGGVSYQVSPPSAPTKIVLTPDTTVLYDGGDMTRIIVSLVDSSGRYIRSRGDSISMSASGAGDFIGEAKSALEGGQFAFYVKTRDGVMGAITCQASVMGNTAITAGTATITVVAANTAIDQSGAIGSSPSQVFSEKNYSRTFLGSRFVLPAWAQKNAHVSVYDLNGRFLFTTASKNGAIDLGKAVTAQGIHVVKIAAEGNEKVLP
jgi:beta-galactosidase